MNFPIIALNKSREALCNRQRGAADGGKGADVIAMQAEQSQ